MQQALFSVPTTPPRVDRHPTRIQDLAGACAAIRTHVARLVSALQARQATNVVVASFALFTNG